MAALNRAGFLAISAVAVLALHPQMARRDSMLDEISTGKTRVVDLSYTINDQLVRWPGDEKVFEAKVNASVEKNGESGLPSDSSQILFAAHGHGQDD